MHPEVEGSGKGVPVELQPDLSQVHSFLINRPPPFSPGIMYVLKNVFQSLIMNLRMDIRTIILIMSIFSQIKTTHRDQQKLKATFLFIS